LKTFLDGLSEVERDFYEERAAILEYDGDMCRENAEIEAARLTSIFFGKSNVIVFGGEDE